jgi:hypothetical protein
MDPKIKRRSNLSTFFPQSVDEKVSVVRAAMLMYILVIETQHALAIVTNNFLIFLPVFPLIKNLHGILVIRRSFCRECVPVL